MIFKLIRSRTFGLGCFEFLGILVCQLRLNSGLIPSVDSLVIREAGRQEGGAQVDGKGWAPKGWRPSFCFYDLNRFYVFE